MREMRNYIGALLPGPAPPEGDWFTRLREWWQEVLEESQSRGTTVTSRMRILAAVMGIDDNEGVFLTQGRGEP
jgi:hypothetical protein